MKERISWETAYDAVDYIDIKEAIAEVLQRGGIAEVKMECRGDKKHITVVEQVRRLAADIPVMGE